MYSKTEQLKHNKPPKVKKKKCKYCKSYFEVKRPLQVVCEDVNCAIEYGKIVKAKKHRQNLKAFNNNDKTILRAKAQSLANKYGRLRDLKSGRITCVTCNKTANKWDGGHCFPTSIYPSIRYYTPQIGMQCINCNQYNGGRPLEYEAYLRIKLGDEKVDWLKSQHRASRKYSVEYLQKLIKVFTKKIKKLT